PPPQPPRHSNKTPRPCRPSASSGNGHTLDCPHPFLRPHHPAPAQPVTSQPAPAPAKKKFPTVSPSVQLLLQHITSRIAIVCGHARPGMGETGGFRLGRLALPGAIL